MGATLSREKVLLVCCLHTPHLPAPLSLPQLGLIWGIFSLSDILTHNSLEQFAVIMQSRALQC